MFTKKIIKHTVRVIIGLGILGIILHSIDYITVIELCKKLSLLWVLSAFSLMIVIRLIMALRWQIILKSQSIFVSYKDLARIIFVSISLGQLLPGGVGADIAKGYQLYKKHGNITDITATLVIDRFIGFYSMFFLAFLGASFNFSYSQSTVIVAVLFVLQIMFGLGWFVGIKLRGKIHTAKISVNGKVSKILRKMVSLFLILTDIQKIKKIFIKIFLISLSIQIIRCLMFFFIYRAFGILTNLSYFILFIPLMFVVTQLPISVGGLGVRESTLIYIFSSLGIPGEVSVSAGLLSYFMQIVAGLPGLVFWIFDRNKDTSLNGKFQLKKDFQKIAPDTTSINEI